MVDTASIGLNSIRQNENADLNHAVASSIVCILPLYSLHTRPAFVILSLNERIQIYVL